MTPKPTSSGVLPPNRKPSTITDVAQAAGVSRTAVSYVLSGRTNVRVPEDTRRRIMDAAARIGYRRNALAAAFRSGRMNTIGIVAPFSLLQNQTGGNVYYKELLLALAGACSAQGMNALLLSDGTPGELTVSDVTDRRADGVILAVRFHAETFSREAAAAGVPCVVIGREAGAWQVHTDNAQGARLAVEHLWDLGHRRMAYLWYGNPQVTSARRRRDGFYHALRALNGSDGDAAACRGSEYAHREVEALMRALRSPDGPTAVFCYNDELGVDLVDRAHAAGLRVPADVSIVGFDDNMLALCARPRLTTIHNPLDRMAEAAVAQIQAQLKGEPPPITPTLIAPWVVVRDSTAAAAVAAATSQPAHGAM